MPQIISAPPGDSTEISLLSLPQRAMTECLVVTTILIAALFLAFSVLTGSTPAQQLPLHLNPAVEKLALGQPILGTQTDDVSLQNCHSLARMDFDYSYVDMEHGPLNLDGNYANLDWVNAQ